MSSLVLMLATVMAATPQQDAQDSATRQEQLALQSLAAWGGSSAVVGAVASRLSKDPQWQAFHEMNAAWGAVNLTLAGAGLWSASRETSPHKQRERWLNYPAIFALNAGLDVGYIAAGAWLWKSGEEQADATKIGRGHAVMLQGGALLIFDAVMAVRFAKTNREIWLSPHAEGVALVGRF